MDHTTVAEVELKSVMSEAELAQWDSLPPKEKLARLRAAIQIGVDSGPSAASMDTIWEKLRTRHSNAKL